MVTSAFGYPLISLYPSENLSPILVDSYRTPQVSTSPQLNGITNCLTDGQRSTYPFFLSTFMTQQLSPRPTVRRRSPRPASRKAKPLSFFKAFRSPRTPTRWWRSYYFLAAGWGIAAMGLLINAGTYLKADAASSDKDNCQKIIQPSAVLSRAQLGKILTVPERSNQQSVRDIVAEPYCQLPSLDIRDGVTATREVYPLAFEPSTWLVMLYEGDEYAGFSFSFQ